MFCDPAGIRTQDPPDLNRDALLAEMLPKILINSIKVNFVIPLGFEPRTLPIEIGMLFQLNYGIPFRIRS